ncbi:MAG: hypothetical protein KJ666_15575 [Bacteroidetes bacterium]|nr:hypothetical protein [Bacteroidota bacterium]MBU2584552.1 hypothetical protein [Bacteroidota bacterium]
MNKTAIKIQVAKRLDKLPVELQKQVLDFTEDLVMSVAKGVHGKRLLKFSGAITEKDANAMLQAIEESCEKVDANGW